MKIILAITVCILLAGCKTDEAELQLPDLRSEEGRITRIVSERSRADIENLFLGVGFEPESSRIIRDQILRRLTVGEPNKTQVPVEVSIRPITPEWARLRYAITPSHEILVTLRYIENGNAMAGTESFAAIQGGEHFYIVWPTTNRK